MTRSWWTKFVILVAFVVTAGIYVYPTLSNLNPETSKFPFKQKVNLGLDLQGGLYLVLGVDFNRVYKDITARQEQSLKDRLKEKTLEARAFEEVKGTSPDDPQFRMSFDPALKDRIYDLIKKEFWSLRIIAERADGYDFGLAREFRNEVRERTVNQSIEVIRNRIDEFGVSEPAISSKGSDRVVVELPGVKDIDRAKELIGRTAKLEFRIVADKEEAKLPGGLPALISKLEKEGSFSFKSGQKLSDYVRRVNEVAKGKIPEGTEIAFERQMGSRATNAEVAGVIPYLLQTKADVTGEDLQDAQVQFNNESRAPEVGLTFNPKGAQAFDKVTSQHIRERLAIVLDGVVHSAPVLQSRISGGRAVITLGRRDGDELMREAKDLAIVLRAGALPAQLEFLEQRAVGPTLGQDSVKNGAMAGIVGCLLIFVFMMFYYRWSGVVAVISLVLNGLFSLAILIGMDATLTLPGMAGIALTIGMAVDSNVIIFERIRDELFEGKPAAAAISAGFDKAFTAIFDANITHGIVAVVLMSYGTGPIRGFAVTLLIGIVTTLFCAVTVCKLFFDGFVSAKNGRIQRLSI